jgi:hypothetical protein
MTGGKSLTAKAPRAPRSARAKALTGFAGWLALDFSGFNDFDFPWRSWRLGGKTTLNFLRLGGKTLL